MTNLDQIKQSKTKPAISNEIELTSTKIKDKTKKLKIKKSYVITKKNKKRQDYSIKLKQTC